MNAVTGAAAGTPVPARHVRLAGMLEAARAGDRPALTQLIDELTPLLWQVARSQGLDHDSAGDVVQTTWLTLLGALETIHSPIALTSWLVTVTKREAWRAVQASRSQLGGQDSMLDELPDPEPVPEELTIARERRRRLWEAVGELPERCQRLLRIVAFTHRPDYQVVSVALGMPSGSIGPTRGRCLAKLRAVLSADPEGSWP